MHTHINYKWPTKPARAYNTSLTNWIKPPNFKWATETIQDAIWRGETVSEDINRLMENIRGRIAGNHGSNISPKETIKQIDRVRRLVWTSMSEQLKYMAILSELVSIEVTLGRK